MNYLEFVAALFIAVCWIWGFEFTFQDGEIFGGIGNWMRKHLPEWSRKPTIDCKYCMASVHGTLMYAILIDGLLNPWYMWVIFCFCCCGATAVFDQK